MAKRERVRAQPRSNAPSTPARKIVTTRPSREVGAVHCRWFQDHPVEHESRLEKQFIHCSLLAVGLEEIEHQPFEMRFSDGTKYTPDFQLRFSLTRTIVVEIKVASKVARYIPVLNRAAQRLRDDGSDLYVITENDVEHAVLNGHVGQVLRYAKSELPEDETGRTVSLVAERGAIRCEEVLTRAQVTIEHVLHLIARRALIVDATGPIGPESVVQLPREEDPVAAFEQTFNVRPWEIQAEQAVNLKAPRLRVRKKPVPLGPYLQISATHELERNGLNIIAGGLRQPPSSEPYVVRAARRLARVSGRE